MNQLIIDCIWCNSKKEFNKFIRTDSLENETLESVSNTVIIDYLTIKNKLMKSDPYNTEPHSSIIGLAITNEIRIKLAREENPIERLIYLFKNLDKETVTNFRKLISSSTEKEFQFNLTIINRDDYPKKGVMTQFDSVKFIEG